MTAAIAAADRLRPAPGAAVRRLDLTDFRNYASLRLETGPQPIVLTGVNGAGKTNLLEALSFLSPGRGLRRAALGEVARIGAAGGSSGGWAVAAQIDTPNGTVTLGTGLDAQGGGNRRTVRLDGANARGQAALAETANIIWLTPDMDRLFQEGGTARRRFLDRMVYGFDPEHAARLAEYEQAMRSRQRLLRDGVSDPAWLGALEETMAAAGTAVAAARRDMVARLAAALDEDAQGSSFPQVGLTLAGEVEAWLDEGPALAAEDKLRAALEEARRRDGESGRTGRGAHRSDLQAWHRDKDMPAAQCSTGEQKALLIAIVLAHARLLTLARGASPILLLDEVAAHLDDRRRAALAERILGLGAQAWLTGTDPGLFEYFASAAQFLTVADAHLQPTDTGPGTPQEI